jgi:hypothetical protein
MATFRMCFGALEDISVISWGFQIILDVVKSFCRKRERKRGGRAADIA